MFQVGECHKELIICLVNVLKFVFVDVDDAMFFFDIERIFERIFYILGIQKSVLDDVAEGMF
jgi:hypothetical protein